MDNLKKYLQQHRQELDSDAPGDGSWNRIVAATSQDKEQKNYRGLLRIAAAACIIGLVAITAWWMSEGKKNGTAPVAKKDQPASKSKAGPDTTAATLVIVKNDQIKQPTAPEKRKSTNAVATTASLINSLQDGYSTLINFQLESIRSTPVYAEGPDYFDEFKTELQRLDVDEAVARKMIKEQGMSEQLLDELVYIYQRKLDILKALRTEIKKMNERVKAGKPAREEPAPYYLNI